MNILKLSDNYNPNYVASIVKIESVRKHSNADKLQIATVFGRTIIVDLDTKVGDIMVYFPVESQLSNEFCSLNNLYEDSSMNSNQDKKGYISHKRRIRSVKLRGEISNGLLLPLDCLLPFERINDIGPGIDFDTIGESLIIQKYIPKTSKPKVNKLLSANNQKAKHTIVEGYYKQHDDTSQWLKNTHVFPDETKLSVSKKYHGTSGIAGYLPNYTKAGWIKRKFFSMLNIAKPTQYSYMCSSRRALRDPEGTSIWAYCLNKLKPFLLEGMTIYYEAIGYIPGTSTLIQPNYDYGCTEGECKIIIYRITYTANGKDRIEFTPNQIREWCITNNFPVYESWIFISDSKNITGFADWSITKEFLNRFDEDDEECVCKVPFEGYVIRAYTSLDWRAFKWKGNRFLNRESEDLDTEPAFLD